MPDYRIYRLHEDGHIAWAPEIVDFANDTTVVNHAKKVLGGHAAQIWDGPRLVIVLKPSHASLAP